MQAIKIVLLAVGMAMLYGVLHDQVTARLCVEYFTIAHPPVFATRSPTLLALGWGCLATWWVGLILGIPAAWLARSGKRRKLTASQLVRPIGVLLSVMALSASAMALLTSLAVGTGYLSLIDPWATEIPREKHLTFMAVAAAHTTSYFVGFVGGVVLCCWIFRHRRWLDSRPRIEQMRMQAMNEI